MNSVFVDKNESQKISPVALNATCRDFPRYVWLFVYASLVTGAMFTLYRISFCFVREKLRPKCKQLPPPPSMPSYFLLYIIRIVSCCFPDSILSHALNRNCSDWCLHYNESVAKTDPIHRAPLRRANRRTTGSLQN